MNAGTSSLLRISVQPFSSFLRASVLPSSASTLFSVQPPTFVRFLTFLYWFLSLSYFSHFIVTYFSFFAVSFFSSWSPALSHTIFHFCYLMKRLGETLSVLLPVALLTVCCSLVNIDSFRPTWMPDFLLCFALRYSHCRLFCAPRCCLLLLQLCLLFVAPTFVRFLTFL